MKYTNNARMEMAFLFEIPPFSCSTNSGLKESEPTQVWTNAGFHPLENIVPFNMKPMKILVN